MPDKKYNGRKIVGNLMEIRNAGGAFSAELLVANPELLEGVKIGDEIDVGMRLVCIDEHFPVEDRKEPSEGGIKHKFVFDPVRLAMVDEDLLQEAFDAHAERVQRAKDAEAGQGRLPTDEELHSAHTAGEHAGGLVEGCVDCEEEAALAAAGK